MPCLFCAQGLLIVDGHWSHIYNLQLINLCREKNIDLLCLPPGQTAKNQPLDAKVFGPLRKDWVDHQNDVDYKADEVIFAGLYCSFLIPYIPIF